MNLFFRAVFYVFEDNNKLFDEKTEKNEQKQNEKNDCLFEKLIFKTTRINK